MSRSINENNNNNNNNNNNQRKHTQKRKRILDSLEEKEIEKSNISDTKTTTTTICPYLDTVNRSLLDFDFEHSCSISLQSGPHIYGCLVCGKFFAGRGPQTPAYIHSVDENAHAVFVHLSKGTFHCLPDDYEIKDASLKDISAALHPTFNIDEIREMDQKRSLARDLFGKQYLPGFVGLNNLNKTDYINATVQALAHVRPLRDFFLSLGNPLSNIHTYHSKKKNKNSSIDTSTFSPLAQCFGDLIRKMWSDKRFKSNVDPHMMIQAVSVASKKRFHIGKQAEAGEFIAWLLHHLHIGIGGSIKKAGSSIIHDIFQGKVEVTIRQKKKKIITNNSKTNNHVSNGTASISASPNPTDINMNTPNPNVASISAPTETTPAPTTTSITTTEWVTEEKINNTHFLQLTLDIPEKPLFKDDEGGLVIPQEPLGNILNKFNGISFHDALNSQRRYRLKKLPNYLILHLARFKRNGFYMEKNPTIVAFPVTNLDLGRYVQTDAKKKNKHKVPTIEELKSMNVSFYFPFGIFKSEIDEQSFSIIFIVFSYMFLHVE